MVRTIHGSAQTCRQGAIEIHPGEDGAPTATPPAEARGRCFRFIRFSLLVFIEQTLSAYYVQEKTREKARPQNSKWASRQRCVDSSRRVSVSPRVIRRPLRSEWTLQQKDKRTRRLFENSREVSVPWVTAVRRKEARCFRPPGGTAQTGAAV